MLYSTGRVSGLTAFRSQVVDHYENPRNVGSLNKNDLDVGTGELCRSDACMGLADSDDSKASLELPHVAMS